MLPTSSIVSSHTATTTLQISSRVLLATLLKGASQSLDANRRRDYSLVRENRPIPGTWERADQRRILKRDMYRNSGRERAGCLGPAPSALIVFSFSPDGTDCQFSCFKAGDPLCASRLD